jgi:hypothetical protein
VEGTPKRGAEEVRRRDTLSSAVDAHESIVICCGARPFRHPADILLRLFSSLIFYRHGWIGIRLKILSWVVEGFGV